MSPPSILLPGLRRAPNALRLLIDAPERLPRPPGTLARHAAAGRHPLATIDPQPPPSSPCRPCPAPESSSMMRKLSNALGQEGRPGTGSRVHPADGAAAAAPQDAPVPDAALSAAADGAAAQQGGSPPGLREQYSPAGEGLQSIAADAAAAAATPEVSSGSITAQMQRKKSTLRISFADPTVSGASSPPKVPLVADASAGGSPNPQSGSGTPAPRKAGRTSMLGGCTCAGPGS